MQGLLPRYLPPVVPLKIVVSPVRVRVSPFRKCPLIAHGRDASRDPGLSGYTPRLPAKSQTKS